MEMGGFSLRAGVAILLSALFVLPAAGATIPELAEKKLDAQFSTLGALQSLVDLFMGRDPTQGTANTATTRWSYFISNAYNLSSILVTNTISGAGGADAYNYLFGAMADPARCAGCQWSIATGLAALGNNSTYIFGDTTGTPPGRAALWRNYSTYLGATDAANATRNVSRLVQFDTSLLRDVVIIYTENLNQTYKILGI